MNKTYVAEWREWAFKNNINSDIVDYLMSQKTNIKIENLVFPTLSSWNLVSSIESK